MKDEKQAFCLALPSLRRRGEASSIRLWVRKVSLVSSLKHMKGLHRGPFEEQEGRDARRIKISADVKRRENISFSRFVGEEEERSIQTRRSSEGRDSLCLDVILSRARSLE